MTQQQTEQNDVMAAILKLWQ